MKIDRPIPDERISDYVQSILVIENYQVTNPFVLPLYANGTPSLLFQTAQGLIKGQSNNLTLFSQTVFPETLKIEDNFTLIAYFFYPYSLYSLFGVSAQELTDYPIDLNLLSYAKARILKDRLLNAHSTNEMIQLLDDYVFKLITRLKSETDIIKFATNKIAKNPNKEILQSVQKELYMTERTFQRLFKKKIGVSPNQFRRISQFNSAFQQLQQKDFNNLTDIAFKNGYSDQSHFIRSFKEFTSIRPKDYLRFASEVQDHTQHA